MDMWTGACVFGAGALVGGWLMSEFYASLRNVQMHERREAAKREAAADQRAAQMAYQLSMKESALSRMELRRACESSWCDGYEAGMREGMRGQTIGDVINLTRLRNARRINGANE